MRHLVLGNGSLLVCLDSFLELRDLYFPYVGMENHVSGHRCRLGFWVDGAFSWTSEADWEREVALEEEALVGRARLVHPVLGLEARLRCGVHYRHNVFVREVCIRNRAPSGREVRVFFHHDFSLGGSEVADTACYDPATGGVLHYKRDRYLLAAGRGAGAGLFQYSVGLKRFGGAEGTWRDAEDGWLEGNPVAHGAVDSVLGLRLALGPGEEGRVSCWLAAGESYPEAAGLCRLASERTPEGLLEETRRYWACWLGEDRDLADLSPRARSLLKQSLLLVRAHCDNRGAILAAADSDIMLTARDHYAYCWPRDGAFVALACDRAGRPEVALRFFEFCTRALAEEGFFFQKYNPDGTPGSTWHSRVQRGEPQLPIQEDETALAVVALWHHYRCFRDHEFTTHFYQAFARRAADFLASYRDEATGLPRPSYDLWEERRGVFAFTAAAVWAGLEAARNLALLSGEEGRAAGYGQAAAEVRAGLRKHLFSRDLGRFLRGVYPEYGGLRPDPALDASLAGIFLLGAFPAAAEEVARTLAAVREGLWVRTPVGGVARYTGDWYFRRSDDPSRVPGNPWLLTTLWLAEWHTAAAREKEDLEPARRLLEWAAERALDTGVLPEQLDPFTGEPLSVAPLAWSHASFVLAALNYAARCRALGRAPRR